MCTLRKHRMTKLAVSLLAFSLCIFPLVMVTMHARGEAEIPMQIHESPQRIVVLPLFAEEMLLEMIGPERIVGVGHEYFENGEAISPTMALTEYIQVLTIDDTEGVLAVKPDLVVLWEMVSNENNYYREALLPELEHAGVPVLFVETPTDFDEVMLHGVGKGGTNDAGGGGRTRTTFGNRFKYFRRRAHTRNLLSLLLSVTRI